MTDELRRLKEERDELIRRIKELEKGQCISYENVRLVKNEPKNYWDGGDIPYWALQIKVKTRVAKPNKSGIPARDSSWTTIFHSREREEVIRAIPDIAFRLKALYINLGGEWNEVIE